MSNRKILVVTGSRADYGHLFYLMKAIQDDPQLELQIIVTGTHLSPDYGLTADQVKEDGFFINDKIESLLSGNTPISVSKSIGLGIIGFSEALERLQPDIMVILGDRFEILAAAQAALIAKIPIAHLHGGEASYGSVDESIRNAITKMSHIHFAGADVYAERIIQMGEDKKNVYSFGGPGLDAIRNAKFLSRTELERELGFSLGKKSFLVTYHPPTWIDNEIENGIQNLISALDSFEEFKIIFTLPNADADGKKIIHVIEEYVSKNREKAISFPSLGQKKYYSMVNEVDLVVGNSSSGLNEVPYFNKCSINVGKRQEGRWHPASVMNCDIDSQSIKSAIQNAIDKKKHINDDIDVKSLPNVSERIKNILKETDISEIHIKRFQKIGV